MSEESLNYQLIHHLLACRHPDLKQSGITVGLARAAAEHVADLLLDLGCQLQSNYIEGLVSVQTYFEPRSSAYIPDIGVSIGMFEIAGCMTLRVMIRTQTPQVNATDTVFEPGMRHRGNWYLPVKDSATPADLLEHLRRSGGHVWRAAA